MPQFLANEDLLSVSVDARVEGQQLLLTHHYMINLIDPASDEIEYVQFCSDFNDVLQESGNLVEAYTNALSDSASILYVVLQKLHPDRLVRQRFNSLYPTGVQLTDTAAGNVAVVLTLQGDEAGRDEISNKHIGAVPGNWIEGGYVAAAGFATYEALVEALLVEQVVTSQGSDITLQPCTYHRASPAFSKFLHSGYVQATSRIMRRRTVGLGS